MKKILGLDLGTNSIGAALINIPESIDDYGKGGNIEWLGSRIVPIDAQYLNKWSAGVKAETKAAARRDKRGSRRLKHRYKIRRSRLIKLFKILGWLNENFPEDFKKCIKNDENFKFKISDYLPFEQSTINEAKELLGVKNKKGELALSEDWIIYYLRTKALIKPISFFELARITYMMNQRRGFRSSRKDLKEENIEEKKWVEILKIRSVEQETSERNKNGNFKFKITPYSEVVNPWVVEKKKKPEWEEKEFTFLITEKIELKKDGTKKITQNNPQIPKEGDWALCVTAQDNKIGEEYPGTYFFNGLVNSIKNNKDFKIRQYAVYRKKYKAELEAIFKKQIELNEELKVLNTDQSVLQKLAKAFYPTQTRLNYPKLKEILSNDLLHFISEDIIYYQRDLKSQKNSKSECKYEKKKGIDGELHGLKCVARSSPEFQEFRIWQDIHNIRIFQRNGVEEKLIKDELKEFDKVDIDVSLQYINDSIKEKLFDLFDSSISISQSNIFDLLNQYNPELKLTDSKHRINMFFDESKKIQGNETKEYFRKIFRKWNYIEQGNSILNDKDKFYHLWNISYSISLNDDEKSKQAIFKALTNKRNKRKQLKQITFDFPEDVAWGIANSPDIEASKKYASFSSKAIQKLLPLMRCGKYHIPLDEQKLRLTSKLETNTKHKKIISEEIARITLLENRIKDVYQRLEEINFSERRIGEVADDDVQKQLLKSFISGKENLRKASNLNTHQASYLVYDRHSERNEYAKYSDTKEFDIMRLLPNNSLRNPIVEQVIRESLFLIKDIWEQYGQPDEIHIELGRDLKKNERDRKKASDISNKNFEERKRIRKILFELMNDEFEQYIHDDEGLDLQKEKTVFEVKPNPDSPVDINKFKLWKDTSGLNDEDFDKKIKDEKIPKQQEIKKYALWLSQKCISPYTGKIIPLSKLFDPMQYEIEHILPKGLLKNDSFDNLVIAEWGVNKAKARELGALFINSRNGSCEHGNIKYKLFTYDNYVSHCKNIFKGRKLKNLLATEIPEDFISRQINDTRYITKKISEILYPVAKGKQNSESDREKGGIIFTIGTITSELKNEWGLQKEWKKLIKPRFERLEKLNEKKYIYQNKKDRNDVDFTVKENEQLDTKRIDHRHHALDALVIAATTIEHIRYLNSLNAVDNDEDLKRVKRALVKGKIREFQLPWASFTEEARRKLEETIVTFKSYNNVLTKPFNKYFKWELSNGKWEKKEVHQKPNKNWYAVKKSLFKEPQGVIYIKEIETKSFRTSNEMLAILKLQIKRNEAQNTPTQKTASYVYDQDTREIVKQIIELSGGDLKRMEQYLKKFKPKNINGEPIYSVRIAVFKSYAAKRVKLDKSFDHKKIGKIPYSEKSRIPLALHSHLLEYERAKLKNQDFDWIHNDEPSNEDKKLLNEALLEAFSEEGLEALDKKIGMKIRMITIKEDIGLKKQLNGKLVEADGNPYYGFYENYKTKERSGFTSLSAYDVIQRKLEGKQILEPKEEHDVVLLQTNDLVYVPSKDERAKIVNGETEVEAIDWDNKKLVLSRLYIVNDFSKTDIYFKPNAFSKAIKSKELHTSYDDKCSRLIEFPKIDLLDDNMLEKEAILIKESCLKVQVDRLGNIKHSTF